VLCYSYYSELCKMKNLDKCLNHRCVEKISVPQMSKFIFKVGILGKTTKEKKTNHEQKI
jgi:hypothetical protein